MCFTYVLLLYSPRKPTLPHLQIISSPINYCSPLNILAYNKSLNQTFYSLKSYSILLLNLPFFTLNNSSIYHFHPAYNISPPLTLHGITNLIKRPSTKDQHPPHEHNFHHILVLEPTLIFSRMVIYENHDNEPIDDEVVRSS